jgi:hypothetical protein
MPRKQYPIGVDAAQALRRTYRRSLEALWASTARPTAGPIGPGGVEASDPVPATYAALLARYHPIEVRTTCWILALPAPTSHILSITALLGSEDSAT